MLAVTVCVASAYPCALASRTGGVTLTGEKAVIVWNPVTHTQHFIRQAQFASEEADYGFVVPTPSVPQLGEVDNAVFSVLSNYVKPFLPVPRPLSGGRGLAGTGGGIEILQVQTVGDYTATTVRAKDGKSLDAWLKQNGYRSRAALTSWSQYYAKKKWVFTALKFTGHRPGEDATQALRLSFRTAVPHYPFKMPKDTWPEGWQRPMTVFVIAPEEQRGRYVASKVDWEAKWLWSGEFSGSVVSDFLEMSGLSERDLPRDPVLTVLANNENLHGYGEDLEFCAPRDPVAWLMSAG